MEEYKILNILDVVESILNENLSNYNGVVSKLHSFKGKVAIDDTLSLNVLYVSNHFLAIWGDNPRFIVFAFTSNIVDKYSKEVGTYADRILFTSLKEDIIGGLLENQFHIGGVTSVIPFDDMCGDFFRFTSVDKLYTHLADKYLGLDRRLQGYLLGFIKK